jgi:Copper amine oxidase N-terminal domain
MNKRSTLVLLTALLGTALAQASYTFTVNGKVVTLATTEKDGRLYVDAAALAKALGASVTVDKGKRSVVIVSGNPKALTEVQGTAQLAGGAGELGKTYSLGKTDNALNFTLKSAEYSLAPVTVGSDVYATKATEKLLVLHYTVQNPQKREMNVYYGSFLITAVDDKDVNHRFDNYIAREGTSTKYDVSLKPAQKIDLYLAFAVPASGMVPKLIVERGDSSPVVRFDLRGKVKALPSSLADPADKSGASVLAEIPARPGQFYPMQKLGVRLESAAFSKDRLGDKPPADGKRYLVATFAIRNLLPSGAPAVEFDYSNFKIKLQDADGERQEFGEYILKLARDEKARGTLNSGEEYKFRVYFTLPGDLAGKTISIAERDSHAYAFDVSQAK